MAEKTTPSAAQVEGEMRKGYAEMQGLYQNGFEAMMTANKAMLNGYQALLGEMLTFSQAQMKEGAEVLKRMAGAGTFDAAANVHAEYMRNQMQAYVDEFKKLGGMTESVTQEVFAPLKQQGEAVAQSAKRTAA